MIMFVFGGASVGDGVKALLLKEEKTNGSLLLWYWYRKNSTMIVAPLIMPQMTFTCTFTCALLYKQVIVINRDKLAKIIMGGW